MRPFLLLAICSSLPAADPAVCAKCHAEIVRSYARTPMAMSSGPAGTGLHPPKSGGTFSDRRSVYHFSIVNGGGHDAGGWSFTFGRKSEPNSTRKLPWRVGSGASASAFLIDVDGFLYEAPVTWYGRTQSWDLSPGYKNYSYPFLTRAIAPGCLECHSSGVRHKPGTQNGYGDPPFGFGGVSCERCHANAEAHARGNGTVANPASLAPKQRDGVCARCHLSGEVKVEGIGFVRAGGLNGSRVTSHVENLAQSACAMASGDKLWCGSCHDPHTVPSAAAKSVWFQAKCQTCHAPGACKAGQKQNCIACHMPRNTTLDAEHVVQTDHSIPRRARIAPVGKPDPDATLIPFGEATAGPRQLGLAYAIMAVRENNRTYANRAFDLLREALKTNPEESQTLSYLADLYKKRNDDANAIPLYRTLHRVDPTDSGASAALGAYAMERGDLDSAIALWNDALSRSPALFLVRVNLANALIQRHRPAEARGVLIKALEFNPNFSAARDLLRTVR